MLLMIIYTSSRAQGPGGVNNGLTIWLKANSGTSGTTISNWDDQSGNGHHGIQTNSGAQPTLTNDGMNFNPSIEFDGTSDYLPISTKSYSGTNSLTGIYVFVVFKSGYSGGGNNNWAFIDFDRSDFFNFYLKGNGSLGFSYNSGGITDNTSATVGFNNNVPHIAAATYNFDVINDTKMYIDGREDYSEDRKPMGATIGTGQTRFGFIGDGSEANSYDGNRNEIYYDGEIAELIYFETGFLSTTERNQIQSYLAIKYGVTLDNSLGATAGDYLSSAGTTPIWDASSNALYHHNVAGIGRDDNSLLDQRKSTSTSNDRIIMEKPGGFASTNDFLLWGNDDGSLITTTAETHASYNYRINRIWKSSVTGNPGAVSVSFVLGNGIVNSGDPSDYGLLIDGTDTDFSSGAIAHTTGATIVGDTLTFTNVSLADGDFFTLATEKILPSPGNVPDNLRLWLKANSGASGSSISTWEDASGNDSDAIQPSSTTRPTQTNTINYNPSISFDGTSQFLPISGLSYTGTNALNGVGTFVVFKTDYSGVNYNDNWALLDFDRSEYFNFYVQGNGALGFSYKASSVNDISGNTTNLNDGNPHIGGAMYDNSIVNDTRLLSDGEFIFNSDETTTGTTIGSSNTRYGIIGDGSEASTFNGGRNNIYYQGEIAEVILYERGDFTMEELSKIQSYLAIKYGITLDNSAGGTAGNYYSSHTNALIWDASFAPNYHNNIIGIGRDDQQDLLQKQSRTIDDTTRIYLSSLAADNMSNTGGFSLDEIYVVLGNNSGKMCATTASNLEKPSGVYSRIEREWKVTNTEFTSQFNVDWTLDNCANIGSISIADLRLLVDEDGNFSNASIFDVSDGLSFAISGNTVTVAGIDATMIPKGVSRFITLGSINIGSPLPIELLDFSAELTADNFVELRWETASEKQNDYFTIERSENSQDWYIIDTVDGAGNSSTQLTYTLLDYAPILGTSYYRLKQTDFNGESSYSKMEAVEYFVDNAIQLFPNPTNGNFSIESREQILGLSMIDHLGRTTQIPVGTKSVDASELDPGNYILQITTTSNVYFEKVIITNE